VLVTKPFQRHKDGRVTVLALFNHYLGPTALTTWLTPLNWKLKDTRYTGEKAPPLVS
jgi:hypothetical protein